jgi:hypothetical protein
MALIGSKTLGRLPAWPRRVRSAPREDYFTSEEHRQEAERLAYVLDGVLQSNAKRSVGDLAMVGILHALLGGQ